MASLAELTLAAQLEQAGIPFEREYRFAPPRRWRADFRIRDGWQSYTLQFGETIETVREPTVGILIEIDGGGYVAGRHSRGGGIEADAEKQSAAAILGYRVLRMTPKQVEDGRGLQWIRQALGIAVAA